MPFEEVEPFLTEQESDEVLALDAAIDRLAALDERAAQVVEHRFYAGFSVEETAELLGCLHQNGPAGLVGRPGLAAQGGGPGTGCRAGSGGALDGILVRQVLILSP